MHLCIICDEYPPCIHGGIGSVTRDLAEGLVGNGHKVTIIGIYNSNILNLPKYREEIINGVRVIRIPSFTNKKFSSRISVVLDRLLLSFIVFRENSLYKFTAVETPDYAGWLSFSTLIDVPLICRAHGSKTYFDHELSRYTGSLVNYLEKMQIHKAHHIIFVSDYTARKSVELFGLYDRQYEIIYNAVDTNYFRPLENEVKEEGKIVFVNTISPKKGAENLIRAFNLLIRSYPNIKLFMVGKKIELLKDGISYYAKLQSIIDPVAVNNIKFLGHLSRDEVLKHLQTAYVSCFPSFSEAFAVAPLESMAVGTPTIYTKTCSGPETIEDGISGLLCNPNDPSDIAEKISIILDNPKLAQELGKNGRKRVLERFNKIDWLRKNIAYYNRFK